MKNLVEFKCGNKIVKEGWSRAAKALCALALGVVVTLGAGVYAAKTHVPTDSGQTQRRAAHSLFVAEIAQRAIELPSSFGERTSSSSQTAPAP